MVISPVLILFLSALFGALILGELTGRTGGAKARIVGAGVGAVAAIFGALLFMAPLNFCTFESDRKPIDLAFGLFLIAAGIALTLWIAAWISGKVLRGESLFALAQPTQGTFKGRIMPFLFLAPTLIILLLFLYYPSIDTLRLSTLLARFGAPRTAFVCVDNFTRLIDPGTRTSIQFIHSVRVTLLMSGAIVVIGLSLSLLIATIAYLPLKGASVYRTLLIWPYAISPAVAGILFLLMFNPTGGVINYFVGQVVGTTIGWTNDPNVAPWTVIIASVWKSMGFNILFYIAGLQNVPKDLIEAGAIDGANVIQRFFRIVLPQLSPITFFLVITNTTYAFFETFGTIIYLTPGGGPLQSTSTMMYEIYELGVLSNQDLGKSAAQSLVLFAMVIALTVFQFRSTGRRVSYGA
jgi:sn-glycerol 3-phosphate transport system permease protein